jgi:DnaK suppressor protein
MGKKQMTHLRKLLLERRMLMLRYGKIGMLRSMSGEVGNAFDGVNDEGDVSHFDQSEKIHYSRLGNIREIIRKIETALERLDSGDYGVCAECGEKIGLERLKIIPYALYCRDCQEARELHQKRRN